MYEALSADRRYKVYTPTANFMLVKILDDVLTAELLFEKAIRQGMMIRDCSTFPFLDQKFFRFCVMSPEMNDKLLACLLDAH